MGKARRNIARYLPRNRVLITIFFSLVFVGIIVYLFTLDELIKNDDSFDKLRNIVLTIIASAGIPFVVLSHVIKVKDLALKTETETLRILMDQIESESRELSKHLNSGHRVGEQSKRELFYSYLLEYKNPMSEEWQSRVGLFLKIRKDKVWPDLDRICQSLSSVLSISEEFRNKDFNELVKNKFISQIGEYDLTILFAVSVILNDYDDKKSDLSDQLIELSGYITGITLDSVTEMDEGLREAIGFALDDKES
ncbi:MAG: hypothetical protein MI810_17940 [Flavobacteriales bacterium]|nr:hypothetical protein [Flavobacteriales bacterium]